MVNMHWVRFGVNSIACHYVGTQRMVSSRCMQRECPMKGNDFKRWRKAQGMSQKEAADSLGLKRRVVQYYEKGERGGEPVKIPRTVRLACYAIVSGITDYQGPEREKKGKTKKPKSNKKSADAE